MADIQSIFRNLRRPKLLIRAARIGAQDYRRERDLKALTRTSRLPPTRRAMESLLMQEGDMEQSRREGDTAYSSARHVALLTALMAEARLLPKLSVV